MHAGTHQGVCHRPDAKDDAGNDDGDKDHHKQKAGAAAGMVLGLLADIFHRQGKARLVAEDGLVLRAMVLEHPVDIALPGADRQVQNEDSHLQKAFHHVPAPQGKAGEEMEDAAGEEGGQHHEQKHGHTHAQNHRQGDDEGLQLLIGKMLFQPQVELAGLGRLVIGVELGGVHQRLDAADHGGQEIHRAPDQRHAQDGIAVLDELQALHLLDQVPLLVPHHDGLLFRSPHHNAFNERLSANAGAEGAGMIFICHNLSFHLLSYHTTRTKSNTCSNIFNSFPAGGW